MSRYLGWFFLAMAMLAVNAPLQALNYEVGGCKTGSGYLNFTTISAAVAGVPAGATIQVCPGVYPEQVTITQPLTLKGIRSGNANRAVITINPNGSLAPNASDLYGEPFYAQLLVQNVSPAGPVNIVGITVDGAGANLVCSSASLAGIFYASSTSGTVNEVTARNQVSECAWGIWVENGSSTNEAITIENSSVHNQGPSGGGIYAVGQPSPTLTATISGNFLSSNSSWGILLFANGKVTENIFTKSDILGISSDINDSAVVSGNTVADTNLAIYIGNANTTVESNKLSNVGTGIAFGQLQKVTTVKSNTIKNTVCAIDFSGGASSSGTISGNVINDSQYGFAEWSGPTITGNAFYNIDTIQTTSSPCP
jgi:Periplasmic copper-binding protein (NosD)